MFYLLPRRLFHPNPTKAEDSFLTFHFNKIFPAVNDERTTLVSDRDKGLAHAIPENDSPSQEDPFEANMYGSAVGLIEYSQAKSQMEAWRAQNPRPVRDAIVADSGIWMIIPHVEYHFGRFGFNDARTAAGSFLFSTTHVFHSDQIITRYHGVPITLRQA
jgi:hypothetical protein